jgi:septal ring factor EnvC (AmiA/AmiB activator)
VKAACLKALATLLVVGLAGAVTQAQSLGALTDQQQEADAQRRALQQQIDVLQKRLTAQEGRRKEAGDALRASEVAISEATRRLKALDNEVKTLTQSLRAVEQQITQQKIVLEKDRQVLAEQLRAQYSSGLSPWSALLSGDDPQTLGRELGYLAYVSEARTLAIASLERRIKELSALEAAQKQQQQSLEQARASVAAEQATLTREQKARATLLARIEGQMAAQRAEQDRLARDEKRLGDLVEGLSEQIDKLRNDAKHAQAIREEILATLPQGEGLKRGIPMPVKGPVMARFGSNRPDGGAWRGVLISAAAGTPVRAVAAGTVVYATWLRGFGNLIIVDHADEFLTIYAHNQSLLAEVGQTVKAGQTIAEVGNTGGQLDSGLYFEIRHRGKPLDPMLYFKS